MFILELFDQIFQTSFVDDFSVLWFFWPTINTLIMINKQSILLLTHFKLSFKAKGIFLRHSNHYFSWILLNQTLIQILIKVLIIYSTIYFNVEDLILTFHIQITISKSWWIRFTLLIKLYATFYFLFCFSLFLWISKFI